MTRLKKKTLFTLRWLEGKRVVLVSLNKNSAVVSYWQPCLSYIIHGIFKILINFANPQEKKWIGEMVDFLSNW